MAWRVKVVRATTHRELARALSHILPSFLLTVAATLAANGCSSNADDEKTAPPAVELSGTLPASDCAAGTMPVVGAATCAPVGTLSCADGFEASATGWGCDAKQPARGCTGTKRAKIGETTCTPIDDCSGPFPPPGAFAIVRSAAELDTALANAPSGATIALDEGVYKAIKIEKDVSLVGRCAELVQFMGPGVRGIQTVGDGVTAKLRSLSVSGFDGAVLSSYGSEVEAASIHISQAKIGFLAGEAKMTVTSSIVDGDEQSQNGANTMLGGKLTLSDVHIRGIGTAVTSFDPKSEIVLKKSTLSYEGADQKTNLVMALRAGAVRIEESLVQVRASSVLFIGKDMPGLPVKDVDVGGSVAFVRSVVRQTGFNRQGPLGKVSAGGSLELNETSVEHQSYFAFMVGETDSKARITNSVIRSAPTDDFYRSALFVTMGAAADVSGTAIISARQNALLVGRTGSRLTLEKSLVLGTEFRGPGPNAALGGSSIGVAAGDDSLLVIKDCAIVKNQQFSVLASDGARVEIARTIVDESERVGVDEASAMGGDAVVVGSSARLSMDSSIVRGSGDAALMIVGGDGIVDSCRFVNNKVGVHLTGTKLREQSTAPPEPIAEELVLVRSTFEATEARVRESEMLLPEMAGPVAAPAATPKK
jgi:hypothetical protein